MEGREGEARGRGRERRETREVYTKTRLSYHQFMDDILTIIHVYLYQIGSSIHHHHHLPRKNTGAGAELGAGAGLGTGVGLVAGVGLGAGAGLEAGCDTVP